MLEIKQEYKSMKHISNEEKAREIGKTYARQYHHNTFEGSLKNNEFVFSNEECMKSALEMAEWKDEKAKSCFILISKLINDGVLTKDNPEHIMVEQMMELYNNLKI